MAGYRHPRYAAAAASAGDALLEVFAEPGPLMAGAHQVGDSIAVLPALFHLMWAHQLVSDLSLRLDAGSTVAAGA